MKPSSSDGLPSYSESLTDAASSLPSLSSYSQHQSAARTAIISDLIRTHITPHLHVNALSGVSQSTLILVPSNMSDLIPPTIASIDSKDAQSKHDSFDGEILVGFPTSENLSMVRLRGEEQTIEFWRQPAVVREVEQRLRETLQRDKLNVFVRVSSDEQWRCLKEKDLVEGEARVGAEIKEICLRIENQIGLYETRTGKALIVRVELGS